MYIFYLDLHKCAFQLTGIVVHACRIHNQRRHLRIGCELQNWRSKPRKKFMKIQPKAGNNANSTQQEASPRASPTILNYESLYVY